ncbi:Uncharacterised protein [uncultured archaeon]|nr:Uncharacterised protein [uncultured archaeon]
MTIMAKPTTLQLPERRTASKTEEFTLARARFKHQKLGMESLLRRLTTSNMRSVVGGQPVLIPSRLVPGCMRAGHQKKVDGSDTLVMIGAEIN